MENSSDPLLTPDEARAARVRARCHAILDARKASLARARDGRSAWQRLVLPVLVGAFCAVYFSTMMWAVIKATVL